jgi:DNA modification methylase
MYPPAVLGNFGLDFPSLSPQVFIKSAEKMEELVEDSVNLVVTSPPYGSIKDYGVLGQIGFQDSFEDYFGRLRLVWGECLRVLHPSGRLVVNVGDQYLRKTEHERYRIVPIGAQIIEDCIALGLDFLGDVIWQKVSTTNTTGGCSLMGSLFYPDNGLFTFDYEHILIFKKVAEKQRKIDPELREYSKIPLDEWKRWFIGHWRFPGTEQKEHVAMFPEELPHRLIRMFSAVGDTVLDPFAGSGTTLKVAWSLLRRSIGYEINPAFEPVIQKKMNESRPDLFRDYQLLLNVLLSSDRYAIDFAFSKQKGITCLLENESRSRIVLDYMLIDPMEVGNFSELLQKKFGENTFSNYQEGVKAWAGVDSYIIVVNADVEKLPDVPYYPRPYLVADFESVLQNMGKGMTLQQCAEVSRNRPPSGNQKKSKRNRSLGEFFT